MIKRFAWVLLSSASRTSKTMVYSGGKAFIRYRPVSHLARGTAASVSWIIPGHTHHTPAILAPVLWFYKKVARYAGASRASIPK